MNKCEDLQNIINNLYRKIDFMHDDNLFYITALNLSHKRNKLEKLATEAIEEKGELQALIDSRRAKK